MMKRRQFLHGAAVGAVAASALSAPAIAQSAKDRMRWRMATSWPKSLDTIYGSAEELCQRVAELTDGSFEVRPFAGGEIVPGLQVFDAVQDNTVECGHTYSSYYIGKNIAYAFDGGLPFGLNARQKNAWIYYGGGLELIRNLFKDANILPIPSGNVGAQMGGWFRKEINSVEDLSGLKMRIAALGGMILSKLGVVPQQLAASDIYTSLEKGTIDAAEWIGPYDDEKLGFVKVAKYYYYPGWWEGSAQITTLVNLNAWQSLSKTQQAAFETACAEQNVRMVASYDAKNPAALRRLVAQGAELRPYPGAVLEAVHRTAFETFNSLAQQNQDFKVIYESWRTFVESSNMWFKVAEYTQDTLRYRLGGKG